MKFMLSATCVLALLVQQQGSAVQGIPLRANANLADLAGGGIGVTSFTFERAGSKPVRWSVEVYDDGRGRYDEAEAGSTTEPRPRPISVSLETLKRLNGGYATVKTGACETKAKNIAQTGAKHIAYRWKNGDAWTQCDFNYSDNEALNTAASVFQAIALTIQSGVKLKHDHRFDHLGLDADLEGLLAGAKEGHCIELQNIAPILQSIVDDDEIMSPSRRKAKMLLDMASVQAAPSAR